MMPARKTLTREELYDLVWATPMNRLARSFGISDQGLAKICKRHDVPRPRQGHWNKLAVGKPVVTVVLPPLRPGVDARVVITPTPAGGEDRPAVEAQLREARGNVSKVGVAERLVQPHPIIAARNARREKEIAGRQLIYDHRLRRLAKPAPFTPMERRCDRVLDAVLKALETQAITVVENERREIIASHGREQIQIQARIKLRQVQRPLTDDERRWGYGASKDFRIELAETDTLIFEVKTWLPSGLKRTWQDGRKDKLETLAVEIVATLIAAFPLMREARERSEDQARLHRTEQQRRQEEERHQKLDRDRYRRLLEHAKRWQNARLAQEYIEALKAGRSESPFDTGGPVRQEWIEWAEASIARHILAESDPEIVFKAVAEVASDL